MIKTLIFDWGGVLTSGRYTRSILGILSKEYEIPNSDSDKVYSEFDKLIVLMNEDGLQFAEFVKKINETANINITESHMRDILKRAIVPNEELLVILEVLQKNYNLIMLSDNDAITVGNMTAHHPRMLSPFSKKYFSYELKIRKPDVRFFKHVLKDAELVPEECIFIDDKKNNVEAAKSCGMNGIVYTSNDQLKKDLESFGVKI